MEEEIRKMKALQKKYMKEMTNNFKLQFPKRWESYNMFFQENLVLLSQKSIHKAILTYCNLVQDMVLLIDIVIEMDSSKGEKENEINNNK